MTSAATLATLEARVRNLLSGSVPALLARWALVNIDEGLRHALEEYSRTRPQLVAGTLTPAAAAREFSLSALTGLISVARVWFPYTAAAPEYPPNWVEFMEYFDVGVPKVLMKSATAPTGAQVARVFYHKLHTLNGLDAATASTFPASGDGLLCIGGAGYACLQRSTEVNETPGNMFVSTPNYGALAGIFLGEFRGILAGGLHRGAQI
jgi:hypothetical protein